MSQVASSEELTGLPSSLTECSYTTPSTSSLSDISSLDTPLPRIAVNTQGASKANKRRRARKSARKAS